MRLHYFAAAQKNKKIYLHASQGFTSSLNVFHPRFSHETRRFVQGWGRYIIRAQNQEVQSGDRKQ
jgi:hypothetical protein